MHQAVDRVAKRKEKTMKKRVRKITAMILAVSMVLGVSGCGKSQKSTQDSGDTAKVKIAYQYGLAYAPLTIMQEQGLIEKNYDGDIEVKWVSLMKGWHPGILMWHVWELHRLFPASQQAFLTKCTERLQHSHMNCLQTMIRSIR